MISITGYAKQDFKIQEINFSLSIQSLNSSAQFSVGENNINNIKLLNNTPEISKEDIQEEMDRQERQEADEIAQGLKRYSLSP